MEVKAVTDTLTDYNPPTNQSFPFKPLPSDHTPTLRFHNPKELTFAPAPLSSADFGGMDIVMEKRRYRTKPRKRKHHRESNGGGSLSKGRDG